MFKTTFTRSGVNILFCSYCWLGAQKENFEKVLVIPPAGRCFKMIDNDRVALESQDLLASGRKLFKLSKRKNWQLINQVCNKLYRHGAILVQFCHKLNKTNFKNKTRPELLKTFNQFSEKVLTFTPSISFAQTIGSRLEEELRGVIKKHFPKLRKPQREDILISLIQPEKEVVTTKEYIDLLKIGQYIQRQDLDLRSKKVNKLVNKHLKKYGWMNIRWWNGQPWNKKDVIARLKNELKKSCQEILKKEKQRALNQKQSILNILRRGQFSEKEKALVKATRENTYLKTYRTDLLCEVGFLAYSLFLAVAQKLGLSYKEFLNCTFREIKDFLQGKSINKKKIRQRSKNVIYIVTPNTEKIIIKKKPSLKTEKIRTNKIKGQIACLGTARSRVKIVKSKSDFKKIKMGDILVCSMTTTDYMPIFKKVSAIITDEGGITCHAAIVSRELNIPCIIGTKIATKVFHDGQLVEVDANKGTVQILKNDYFRWKKNSR